VAEKYVFVFHAFAVVQHNFFVAMMKFLLYNALILIYANGAMYA